ncbi:MAG: hypothetical protein K2K98_05060 [Muribaculaceae bacterium]|nr:hypothetical protein [Muribaculaceae bacterium]
MSIYPQEKFHMVTDRDIYCGGDTVWFRLFVVDAGTHQPMAISKYAYVELLNPFGKVHHRVKVMERDGIYAGYLPINTDIYEGDYTLAAYTAYAENQGQDYFFKKPLKVLSLLSDRYSVETDLTPLQNSMIAGNFRLKNADGSNIRDGKTLYITKNGRAFEALKNRSFKRDFNLSNGASVILVQHGEYGKFIPVENIDETDIKLAFYPEGGWLIEGVPCKVAFKATDYKDKGVELSGFIYEKDGNRIADFKTTHNGMGCVSFIPESGKTYLAEYIGPDFKKHTAEIGSPKAGAASLHYSASGTKCTFSLAGGPNKPYELVVACRGLGVFALPISTGESFTIDRSELLTGLHQALLVSPTDSVVVSERLFFVGADRHALMPETAKLTSDSISLILKALSGNTADCSIRILKSNTLRDENTPDILSQMLLQSELRGRIENPGYYFRNPDRETEQNLDLLMMVNGWSRYNLPDALLGHFEEPTIPLEIGQEITGQVRSRWKNKPMEGVMVNAIVPKKSFGTFADTDKDGIFRLNGFDFPENTPFILKAMNEKGNNEGNFEIFDERFPTVKKLNDDISVGNDTYLELLTDNKWKLLDVVNVTARSKSGAGIYGFDTYGSLASYSCNSNDFKTRGITSIEQAMRGIPGISSSLGYLKWRGAYIIYYLDGQIFETDPNISSGIGRGPTVSELEAFIPFDEIERIDFVRPEHTLVLGRTYGGGAIMIMTKQGNKRSWQKQFELKDHLPLGYQQYKEYASPLLSVDSDLHDLQSEQTLLWLPSVKFDDAGKSIDLKHPVNSGYNIIIEGISENGDIIFEIL